MVPASQTLIERKSIKASQKYTYVSDLHEKQTEAAVCFILLIDIEDI